MDCSDVQQFLHAYIDQEFDGREKVEFEVHFSQCSRCREEALYYRSLHETLRNKTKRKIPPVHLQVAIRQALDEEEQPTFGWFSLSLATAGAFFCALGIFIWTPTLQDNIPVAERLSQPHGHQTQSLAAAPYNPQGTIKAVQPSQMPLNLSPNGVIKTSFVSLTKRNHPKRCIDRSRNAKIGWLNPSQPAQDDWFQGGKRVRRNAGSKDTLCDPPRAHPFLVQASLGH